jgi:glycosyltransferase involved in cell wall biosynthesis
MMVSIIIPCRNEEKFIADCLDSVILQDFAKDKMEILVVDGMSEDKTRETVREYAGKYPFVRLLENQKRITPSGLNVGIKESKGDIIIRMDAHARYKENYISKCVEYLQKGDADNVGGVTKTISADNGLVPKAVALCLNSVFGSGNSRFRTGADKPMYVDTVFGGCYKKEVFEKVGLFNENMARSQDIEFNLRLRKFGGKILLVPEIISYYYPKSSIREFFSHNFEDGIWAILPLKFIRIPFYFRHYIPLIFLLTLPLSVWPYIVLSLYFSFKVAAQYRDMRLFFLMPLVFGARHIGYGLGSLAGVFKLFLPYETEKKRRN